MSAQGRPKREWPPAGAASEASVGVVMSAQGRPKRECPPRGQRAKRAWGSS
jgi:hypothetical protein